MFNTGLLRNGKGVWVYGYRQKKFTKDTSFGSRTLFTKEKPLPVEVGRG
jgi:hypothetical protein